MGFSGALVGESIELVGYVGDNGVCEGGDEEDGPRGEGMRIEVDLGDEETCSNCEGWRGETRKNSKDILRSRGQHVRHPSSWIQARREEVVCGCEATIITDNSVFACAT